MALQANIPLQGGISHNNGYVRVTNARLCRKDNEDDLIKIRNGKNRTLNLLESP